MYLCILHTLVHTHERVCLPLAWIHPLQFQANSEHKFQSDLAIHDNYTAVRISFIGTENILFDCVHRKPVIVVLANTD